MNTEEQRQQALVEQANKGSKMIWVTFSSRLTYLCSVKYHIILYFLGTLYTPLKTLKSEIQLNYIFYR